MRAVYYLCKLCSSAVSTALKGDVRAQQLSSGESKELGTVIMGSAVGGHSVV